MRKQQQEVFFTDEYFVIQEVSTVFIVQGEKVIVKNEALAIALLRYCKRKWRRYKMRNGKHKMLPYEVIEKAVAGEPEAVHKVARHYIGYSDIYPFSRIR